MAAILLLNFLLQHNPHIAQQMAGYNGLVLSIRGTRWQAKGRIDAHGLLRNTPRAADTAIVVQDALFRALAQGQLPDLNHITFEGDAELGARIALILAQLRMECLQPWQTWLTSDGVHFWQEARHIIGQAITALAKPIPQPAPSPEPTQQMLALQSQLADTQEEIILLKSQLRHLMHRLDDLEWQRERGEMI